MFSAYFRGERWLALTNNKKYTVYAVDSTGVSHFLIVNDQGQFIWYPMDLFRTIKEK